MFAFIWQQRWFGEQSETIATREDVHACLNMNRRGDVGQDDQCR